MPRDASELLHGTLDVLVLKTLSWGAMHGYGIAEWIEQHGSGALVIVDAALLTSLPPARRAREADVRSPVVTAKGAKGSVRRVWLLGGERVR